MAAGPRYTASVRTAQKTMLTTVALLLRVTQTLLIRSCFSGSTILALSKYTIVCKQSSWEESRILTNSTGRLIIR
jgi:hypothetical protein